MNWALALAALALVAGCKASAPRGAETQLPPAGVTPTAPSSGRTSESEALQQEAAALKVNLPKWEMAYVDTAGDLYLSRGDGSDKKLVAKAAQGPTWSRDGKLLAYIKGSDVVVRDMATEAEKTVFHDEKLFPTGEGESNRDEFEVNRFTFDPESKWLVIPYGQQFKYPSLVGRPTLDELGGWRQGKVAAADVSASGDWIAFTSYGDVWLGRVRIDEGTSERYVTCQRLAPLAEFSDDLGNSASTPDFADDVAWFPDEKSIIFHYQRQHGSGTSVIGVIDLKPAGQERRPWGKAYDFAAEVRWFDLPNFAFCPSACPDNKTLTVSTHLGDSDEYRLVFLSRQGKVVWDSGLKVEQAVWRPVPKPHDPNATRVTYVH